MTPEDLAREMAATVLGPKLVIDGDVQDMLPYAAAFLAMREALDSVPAWSLRANVIEAKAMADALLKEEP